MTASLANPDDGTTLISNVSQAMARAPDEAGISSGQVLAGRYRVGRMLAMGGMGTVYEARHVALDSPVAIKMMRPELARDPESSALFRHEARATALLRSDHTVRVFDLGELATGVPFLVMERLEGTDLEKLLATSGKVSVEVAADYAIQACRGLTAAHALGLIHRDIKPANLFLDRRGPDEGVVKLLDFGASKWLWTDPLDAPAASASVGSPAYQSPEQLEDPNEVDQRSDIWSLGAVLFELLTGRRAFAATNASRTFSRILHEPTPSLHEFEPDLAPGIEAIVQRCLEKRPVGRFVSADELGLALLPFSSHRPLAHRPPANVPRTAIESPFGDHRGPRSRRRLVLGGA